MRKGREGKGVLIYTCMYCSYGVDDGKGENVCIYLTIE